MTRKITGKKSFRKWFTVQLTTNFQVVSNTRKESAAFASPGYAFVVYFSTRKIRKLFSPCVK